MGAGSLMALPDHGRAAREGAARVARKRPRALEPEDARRAFL